VTGLRDAFALPGPTIRMFMRSQNDKNPFKGRKKAPPSKLRKHLEGRRES
jgi:GTP-binding protein